MASEPLKSSDITTGINWLRENGSRLLKFGSVGLSGVLVNLVIFTLAFHFAFPLMMEGDVEFVVAGLLVDLRFVAANAAGFVVSVFTNFLLNDVWTWGDRKKGGLRQWFRRLIKYYVTASGAGAVQILTAALSLSLLWAPMAPTVAGHDLAPTLGLLTGIAWGMAINFTASHLWAFRDARSPSQL